MPVPTEIAPQRPLVLTVGMLLAGFPASVGVMMGLTTLLVPGGTYTVNGEPVTREHFLTHAMPFVALVVALSLVVLYGLWKHKGWVPLLVMGIWTALAAFAAGMALGSENPAFALISGILPLLLPAGASLWVLFGYEEVVQYYRHLRALRVGTERSSAI